MLQWLNLGVLGSAVDPDVVSDLQRLSQGMWIIRAVVEFLIDNELHVSRSIDTVECCMCYSFPRTRNLDKLF